jgi:hypothetical protein
MFKSSLNIIQWLLASDKGEKMKLLLPLMLILSLTVYGWRYKESKSESREVHYKKNGEIKIIEKHYKDDAVEMREQIKITRVRKK